MSSIKTQSPVPDRIGQSVGLLTRKSGALGLIPGLATYFRFSFRFFEKGSRLGGLSLPRKSVVRVTDRPDLTLDVYRERKTTIQQQNSKLTLVGYVIYQDTNSHCYISKKYSSDTRLEWYTTLNYSVICQTR